MNSSRVLASIAVGSLFLAAISGTAGAGVDPALSSLPPTATIAPGPLYPGNPIGTYTVHIFESGGSPVLNATVTLTFTAGAIPLIAWCGGVPPGPVVGHTDAAGDATLLLPPGSGCVHSQPCAIPPAKVTVVGPAGVGGSFTIDLTTVNSPDVVDSSALLPACPAKNNCVGGNTSASLVDAVYHTRAIKLGLVDPCTKVAPPFLAPVGILDAVYLTPFLKAGNSCGC